MRASFITQAVYHNSALIRAGSGTNISADGDLFCTTSIRLPAVLEIVDGPKLTFTLWQFGREYTNDTFPDTLGLLPSLTVIQNGVIRALSNYAQRCFNVRSSNFCASQKRYAMWSNGWYFAGDCYSNSRGCLTLEVYIILTFKGASHKRVQDQYIAKNKLWKQLASTIKLRQEYWVSFELPFDFGVWRR